MEPHRFLVFPRFTVCGDGKNTSEGNACFVVRAASSFCKETVNCTAELNHVTTFCHSLRV